MTNFSSSPVAATTDLSGQALRNLRHKIAQSLAVPTKRHQCNAACLTFVLDSWTLAKAAARYLRSLGLRLKRLVCNAWIGQRWQPAAMA
jgi:hypothetical protein